MSLAAAMERLGLACDVEADGGLAILVPRPGASFPDGDLRAELVRAARQAGFAGVAFELCGAVPNPTPPAA